MLVILESTTYPGTTFELVLPMLETDDLRVGHELFRLLPRPSASTPGNPKYPYQEHTEK